VRTSEHVQAGKRAVVVDVGSGQKPAYLQQYVQVLPRRTYRLTFWYRVEGVTPTRRSHLPPIARLIERDEDDDWLRDPSKANDYPKCRDVHLPLGTKGCDWTQAELLTTTEREGSQFQILFQLVYATGRLYIDGVKLELLEGLVGDWPKERLDGTGLCSISTEVVTPHTVWAKPWVKGKTTALFIIPKVGMREVAELHQRMDLEFDAVVTWSPTYLGLSGPQAKWEGTSTIEKNAQLEGYLKNDYDVIVVANFQWGALEEDHRYEILKKVHSGRSGLVIVFEQEEPLRYELERLLKQPIEDSREFVTGAYPFARLRWGYCADRNQGNYVDSPRRDANSLVRTCALGRGRCVYLTWPYPETLKHKMRKGAYGCYLGTGLTPYVLIDGHTYRDYEYYQILIVRSLLWAAQKDVAAAPAAQLPTVQAGEPAEMRVEFRGERLTAARLDWSLRDSWKIEVKAGQTPAAATPDGCAAVVPLPPLPRGDHLLEYRLAKEGKVWHFGAVSFTVDGGLTIRQFRVGRGDMLSAVVETEEKVSATLTAKLWDNYGRLVSVARGDLAEGRGSVQFAVPAPLTMLHRLDLRVEDSTGRPMASAHRELCVPGAPRPTFNVSIWGSNDGSRLTTIQNWAYRNVYGIDGIYLTTMCVSCRYSAMNSQKWPLNRTLGRQYLNALRANADAIPWFVSVIPLNKTLIRKPCLTDPRHVAKTVKEVETGAKYLAEQGMVSRFGTFGDEFILAYPNGPDFCFSDTCRDDFRQYVKGLYPSLDALNKEWGTSPTKWEEVEPITLTDAKKAGQIARWADHRMHMDGLVLRHLDQLCSITRQHLPGMKIGYEGMFRSYSECGYNVERILQVVDFINTYLYPYRAVQFRGLKRPGTLAGYFCNGLPKYGGEWKVWHNLLNGFSHLFWWRADDISGCFSYDLTPVSYRGIVEVTTAAKEVKQGIATLVANATRLPDSVAVLYSQPSIHASKAYGSQDDILDAHLSVVALLNDLHVGYTMVGSLTVGKPNWWKDKGLRVLILPYTQAIEAPVATGIREFCRQGGTVIADVRPGVLDGHCKFAGRGSLDDLFGIKRTSDAALEDVGDSGGLGELKCDPGLALATGAADRVTGGTPVMVRNQFGKGRALLLNFLATAYRTVTRTADFDESAAAEYAGNDALLSEMARFLSSVGVEPLVQHLGESTKLRHVQTTRWQKHQTQLIGFARHYLPISTDIKVAEIGLGQPAHLYDVRKGKYVGQASRFAAGLPVGSGALFAALPYKVEALRVSATPARCGGEVAVRTEIAASNDEPKYHVLFMRVHGPDGRERTHYSRPVVLDGQAARARIPLALNDDVGTWRVRIRDVISGEEGECQVAVSSMSRRDGGL